MVIEQPFPTLFALVTTKSCPILSSSFENFPVLPARLQRHTNRAQLSPKRVPMREKIAMNTGTTAIDSRS